MRVPQVEISVRIENPATDVLLVLPGCPDALTALAHDDRRAGVLAHRQDAPGGDVGVLQQIEGDEAIVGAGFGVIEDGGELCQVIGAKQVRDVVERLVGQQSKDVGFDGYKRAPAGVNDVDSLGGDKPIGGFAAAGLPGQQIGVGEIRHDVSVCPQRLAWRPISEPIRWRHSPRPPKSTAAYVDSFARRCSLRTSRMVPLLLRMTIE